MSSPVTPDMTIQLERFRRKYVKFTREQLLDRVMVLEEKLMMFDKSKAKRYAQSRELKLLKYVQQVISKQAELRQSLVRRWIEFETTNTDLWNRLTPREKRILKTADRMYAKLYGTDWEDGDQDELDGD